MSRGTLRGSLRRLFSLTSSETTLVKTETPPSTNNRVLIVGLGNYPAPRSRHSVGQYLLHAIAERNSVQLSYKRSCKAHLASFHYNDAEVYLLKPKHFMNLNGKSVIKATSALQISPTHVILLHDELDLPLGKFKVKHGGSANGHNGVIDTQERLKFSDVKRLRIGIGRPDKKNDVMDYVLEDFNRNERNQLAAMKDTMIDTVHQIIAVILSPPDAQEAHITKLNTALEDLPEWKYERCTPSPQWTPPSPRNNANLASRVERQTSATSDPLTTLVVLGALHKANYNNTSNRNSRIQEQAPSTPGSPGRRRYSSETVPKIFPYDELDVRKDCNKRESKIDRTCNKRLDYRHYRMDRRDSDSSRD
ncbi:hypothetical protein ACHWQZ_G008566 [Mnemiopsis leidyi]